MKEKMIQYFEGCGFSRAEAEKEGGIKYSKLIPNEMDLCDECFKNLVVYLGME